MPRNRGKLPSYCQHKASGRAVVRIDGRDHYLGVYGSDESHAAYERLIAEWRQRRQDHAARRETADGLVDANLTIAEVLLRYREYAQGYYVKNGEPTKELTEMRLALRPLRKLYGSTLAREFGPLKLKALRQHMVDVDLSRGVINNRINRVKRFFKWAVSEQLVPPSVFEGLRTVSGLKYGRTEARETEPVQPVSPEFVDAVLPHVSPPVAAMIRLQQLTGMRPCEVVLMRACDIDQSEDVWVYEPYEHKNQWRGHSRLIPLGPRAQEILGPFLSRPGQAFLFSPQEAEQHRNAQRRTERKTPMTPSQSTRTRKSTPNRVKRERYDTDSYRRAITYGIEKANRQRQMEGLGPIPKWYPLQLRHSRATELNRSFGIEAAAVSLGHAHADVTKVYAARNLALAKDVARKTG